MRVITGSAKGCKLKTLVGLDVRPTTERVKEGLFSSIQFDLPDAAVLDLFAGSGQLGIEALSRGAKSCIFVDQSERAINVIRNNLRNAQLSEKAKLVNRDYQGYLKSTTDIFNVVFLDPPYNRGMIPSALELLERKVTARGIVICEHEQHEEIPEKCGSFLLGRQYRYGKIMISIYHVNKGR